MSTLTYDERGLYQTEDGYLAVALGDFYGSVGDKFRVTLDTGIVLKVIRADTKADSNVVNQCYHKEDGSILEFIIDTPTALSYYGTTNGLVANGNFNNIDEFKGNIIKIEKYNQNN